MKKQNSLEVSTAFSCGKLLTARIYKQPRYIKARDAYCYRIKCVFSNGMEKWSRQHIKLGMRCS